MNTLEELRSGKLKGAKRITLSENLDFFPEEIFELADTLEILDLSNNNLDTLPKNLHRLTKLKIAFFSNNNFTALPNVFKECKNLYMIGFKANKIELFDENILPLSISWLILTDNRLKSLPHSIGKLTKLQKCALAGNQLVNLPSSMSACVNLELIRLSANNLEEIPLWLSSLPKLSWLAFSGNPCSISKESDFKEMVFDELEVAEVLGEGASGIIYKAYSKQLNQSVAIKLFKGAVTSDGYAKDEMNAYMSIENHPNLIKVIAKLKGESRLGLLLEFIPSSFINLGNPPNFDTCTRDTFEESTSFSINAIRKVAESIASAAGHLHENSLMHGDLYAHNILINEEYNSYLGDFGAASFYDKNICNYEKIEVRAFGCLLDDMLALSTQKDEKLEYLKDICMSDNINDRPLFSEMKF